MSKQTSGTVRRWANTSAMALGLLSNLAGCCPNAHQIAQAPPPPPEPCPAPATPPAPPPPPPPKCESLAETCRATKDTRLAVGDHAASFQVPDGWTYAKEPDQSVAISPDGKASIAFTEVASKQTKVLLDAVERLVARLEIDKVRLNLLQDRLKKPQHELEGGSVVTQLWEVDKKSQFGTEPKLKGTEEGTLLLAVTPLSSDQVLVGTAFVTTDAGDAHAPVVMQSVGSLAPLGATGTADSAPTPAPASANDSQ